MCLVSRDEEHRAGREPCDSFGLRLSARKGSASCDGLSPRGGWLDQHRTDVDSSSFSVQRRYGGLSRVGASIPSPPFGSQFEWSEAVSRAYEQTCSELAELDTAGYGRSPGNLEIALRSFMATYDRWPPGRDSQ